MHAFRSGICSASDALKNWYDSKTGNRSGPPMGFPVFKSKRRSTPAVSFVELNHQLSWLANDRHHIRLMLPKAPSDADLARRRKHLGWLHTVESTSSLYRLVASGAATIQKVTLSYRGGRWRAGFQLRYREPKAAPRVKRRGTLVGVDVGIRHLATLSQPVAGLTDDDGHVLNPNVLEQQLQRLKKIDRQVNRATVGSKSHRRLLRRRARLHGRVAQTRALHLHRLSTALAGAFEVVALEDLNLKGMSNRKGHLGRRFADAGLSELRRQLIYKTADQGHTLVSVGRFYPSSKTCSHCGVVKTKLHRWNQVFACDSCGMTFDRDVNAARNIAQEAIRLRREQQVQQNGAGLRPESANAAPRPGKTVDAQAEAAGSLEGGTEQSPAQKGEGLSLGRGVGNDARNGKQGDDLSCRT